MKPPLRERVDLFVERNFKTLLFVIWLLGVESRLLYWILTNGEYLRDEFVYLQRMDYITKYGVKGIPNPYVLIMYGSLFPETYREIIVRGSNLLLSSLNLPVIYYIGKMVFRNEKPALALMTLFAFNPFLIRSSASILREPGYIFVFSVVILLCVISLEHDTRWGAVLTAFMAAFSFWTRYEGIELFFFYCIALAYKTFKQGMNRNAMANLLLYSGVYIVCMMLLFILLPEYCLTSIMKTPFRY